MKQIRNRSSIKSNGLRVKGNCLTCNHRRTIVNGESICIKRIYLSPYYEDKHTKQLSRESYLQRAKSCYEIGV